MASSDNDAESFLRTVMMKLNELSENLADYADKEAFFSSEVATEMKKIKESLTTTLTKLQADYDRISGARDPIVQLLNSHNIRVSFDSIHQNLFRLAILSIEPTQQQQIHILQQHLYPCYYSTLPALLSDPVPDHLPTNRPPIPKIALEDFQTAPITHQTVNLMILLPDSQRIPQTYGVSDNVFVAMKQLIPRLLIPGLQPSIAAFKVLGLNEYIYGDSPFSSFLSIREAVHKNRVLDVELVTMKPKLSDKVFFERILTFWKALREEFYEHAGLPLEHEDFIALEGYDMTSDTSPQINQQQSISITPLNNRWGGGGGGGGGSSSESDDRVALNMTAFDGPLEHSDDHFSTFQHSNEDDHHDRSPAKRHGFGALPKESDQASSRGGRGRTNMYEDAGPYSRFNDPHLRGISVAPRGIAMGPRGSPQTNLTSLRDEDGDDDGQIVLRPLNQCQFIDTQGEDDDDDGDQDGPRAIRITKLSSLQTVNYEMDEDERYSKRMSGVINIPTGLMSNNSNSGDRDRDRGRQGGLGGINALLSSQMTSQMSSSDDEDFTQWAPKGTSFFDAQTSAANKPTPPQPHNFNTSRPQSVLTSFAAPEQPQPQPPISPSISLPVPAGKLPNRSGRNSDATTLDFRGEVKMSRDIQERRRRSIVREEPVNDSDEDDFPRSRQNSHSTTRSNVTNGISDPPATPQGPEVARTPSNNDHLATPTQSARDPSPFRVCGTTSPTSPQLSTPSSSTTSPTPSTSTPQPYVPRRGSVLSSSKNSLFKFSTLTNADSDALTAGSSSVHPSSPTLMSLEEDHLFQQAIAGKMFVPAIPPATLDAIRDDDQLLCLNLNREDLGFDVVARHHRLMGSALLAEMTIASTQHPAPQTLALANTALPVQHSAHYTTTIIDLAHQSSFKLPPFSIKVHGADNITAQSCPRLGSMTKVVGGSSKLSIVAAVLSNNTTVRSSLSNTAYIEICSAPRWHQEIVPPKLGENQTPFPPLQYLEIPRHSRVAFMLVESILPDSPKESVRHVPLAWAAMTMFGENDLCAQGIHHLQLWPIANNEGDCAELGASQYLLDQYNTNCGRLPKKDEKEAKKSKKDDKTAASVDLGLTTVIDGLDIKECPFLFRGASGPNLLSDDPITLTVEFPSFNSPIINTTDSLNFPIQAFDPNKFPQTLDHCTPKHLPKEKRAHFDVIVASDALHQLTDAEKEVIWLTRESLSQLHPHLLPLFIQSVNWALPDHKHEALRILELWRPPRSFPALLSLLDSDVSEFHVRSYAVRWLQQLAESDLSTLQLFSLQLTQCIKFEPYHNSPLVRFLLDFSIKYPYQIGHYFYWHLKNESACDPPFSERYRIILEAYLTFSPLSTDSLRTQQHIIDEGSRLATKVRNMKNAGSTLAEYMQTYQQGLQHLNRDYFGRLPGKRFQIPLDPRWEAEGLIPEKCKIMSSKMAPLWLVFKNADPLGPNFYTIFKAGDDLRQDILTLQILRFLDKIWMENGLDLRLSPYNVLATGTTAEGKGCGMIQVVLNSTTTSAVQAEFGGGASGAFKEDTIWQFLVKNNPEKDDLAKAVDNFTRSCAGYCVATYVLGIGDRHNGNIMVTNDGYLFHIDFGHFLGNFKSKLGINRERSRFVFTKEMAFAMGGSSKISGSKHPYKVFVEYCVQAIELVRQHAHEIETLFLTMIGAGMPELTVKSSILYIRDKLALLKTSQATKELFLKELDVAINCTSRTWDNFMHNLKHR